MAYKKKVDRQEEERRNREWEQERVRIEAQRALFAAIPDSQEKQAFEKSMLDRAWVLIDNGKGEAADAILEFIPSDKAQAMLDEYFFDPLEKKE